MKKKILPLIFSFICMSGFTACGDSGHENNSSEHISENVNEAVTETDTEKEIQTRSQVNASEDNKEFENNNGKVLVVYYSASGNTEEVAGFIAKEVEGDLFEIEPVDVYTDADLDWTNQESRVCYEHDNPDVRDIPLVSTEVTDWDSYETVFIGYPIWWGEAAWVVDNFVKENDFTDKIVIPFCTSSSSGLGESGILLADMAGTGNWQTGEGFRSGASEDDISVWVKSLDLN